MDKQKIHLLVTFSQAMIKEFGGIKAFEKEFETAINNEMIWNASLGNKPTQEIEGNFCYVIIGGKIVYRTSIVGVRDGEPIRVYRPSAPGKEKNKIIKARKWLMLSAPLVKVSPSEQISRKGFQGFRYTEFLF